MTRTQLRGTGIDPAALARYLKEQVYTLPGAPRPREQFTVLLTGSRATGTYAATSDVDIDVLCPQSVYRRVIRESLRTGRLPAPGAWFVLRDDDWGQYFGRRFGRPHFTLHPLEHVARDIRRFDDARLWIWSHARVLRDPAGRFTKILRHFRGYPRRVLVRKIKYHWLLAGYWEVDGFPWNARRPADLLPAASAVLNAVNELSRLCFLVEGKPFPYFKKLMHLAPTTRLGKRIVPTLRKAVALVTARGGRGATWARIRRAGEMLACSDISPACRRLEQACARAMIRAGVPPAWVRADFDNIEELYSGKLGPPPK